MESMRKDYLNGVRGVFEVFENEDKSIEFWFRNLEDSQVNRDKWKGREPHLAAWYLGRVHAFRCIIDYMDWQRG